MSEVTRAIAQLREVTDILQATQPNENEGFYIYGHDVQLTYYGDDAKERIAKDARAIRRDIQSHTDQEVKTEKEYDSSYFRMVIDIPNSYWRFTLSTPRSNVCTKKIVGTETKMVTDYANAPQIEKTVDVIEWQCDPSILAL